MPFNLGGPVIMPHRVLTECLTKVNGVICQWLFFMFKLFFFLQIVSNFLLSCLTFAFNFRALYY